MHMCKIVKYGYLILYNFLNKYETKRSNHGTGAKYTRMELVRALFMHICLPVTFMF